MDSSVNLCVLCGSTVLYWTSQARRKHPGSISTRQGALYPKMRRDLTLKFGRTAAELCAEFAAPRHGITKRYFGAVRIAKPKSVRIQLPRPSTVGASQEVKTTLLSIDGSGVAGNPDVTTENTESTEEIA